MKKDFDDYLTIAEAAEYVGVSPATLRRWDSSEKLKAVRRPGSNYRYYSISDLEPFRLEYNRAEEPEDTVAGFFADAQVSIDRNPHLREPQREAFDAAVTHFDNSPDPAIVQLPVGCGKTGVAALLPFGISQGRVLLIAPNTTIREGLYADLNISNAGCFWKKTGVLSNFSKGPFTALVDGPNANIDDCRQSHIVVANIQQLASKTDRWLSQFPRNFFDLIIIDEGHHVAAESWQKVVRAFPNARIVSLTATPFRSDNQDLLGELIYTYSFIRAMVNGYITHVSSVSARPTQITFTMADDPRVYELDEILELKEEAWFRRGVALSDECNRHIAEKAKEKLAALRSATGFPHQIIASAMSVDHARQVRAIFEELGLQAAEIYGEMPPDKKEAVFAKLRSGQLDCIVQVQMLGEGFDHPPLSVAAIFRPYRSLAPYVQFIGRVLRTVEPNDPGNPNNQAYIVSHVGLNNEDRWDDFRELDADDRDLVSGWIHASGDSEPQSESLRNPSLRFDDPVADHELLSHFITQSFLDPDDDNVMETLLDAKGPGGFTYRDLGITADQLRVMFEDRKSSEEAAAESTPVQPQVRRQTLRNRLDSRSKSVHNRILNDLGLARAAYDISRSIADARGNNADALYALLNTAINEFVGQTSKSRGEWSANDLKLAYDSLDSIGDQVSLTVSKAIRSRRGQDS